MLKKKNLILLLLLFFLQACGKADEETKFVIVSVNVPENYVVINAGRDKDIRVGDNFAFSRDYRITAHVKVFEVLDKVSKARARGQGTVIYARVEDKGTMSRAGFGEIFLYYVLWAGLPLFFMGFFWLIYRFLIKIVTKFKHTDIILKNLRYGFSICYKISLFVSLWAFLACISASMGGDLLWADPAASLALGYGFLPIIMIFIFTVFAIVGIIKQLKASARNRG